MTAACIVCGDRVDQTDGSLFVGDDGECYCADHYPDREVPA